ncbi:MAG: hypothetical protein LBS27_11955 [Bifidobacteriaceae bacterium]|jgi:hypothetical protein|nr:hypothetical protein [Bifidobacteriaceae bacterium]
MKVGQEHLTRYPDGLMFEREEFAARKIGHDNAFTNYTVNRPNTSSPSRPSR